MKPADAETDAADPGQGGGSAVLLAAPVLVEALTTGQPPDDLLAAAHAADLVVPGQSLNNDAADMDWTTAGPGIEPGEHGWRATRLGYLYCVDGCLQIVSPIVVDPQATSAHFILLQGRCPAPSLSVDVLLAAVELAGVRHGIIASALDDMCDSRAAEACAVLLAQASTPVHGCDGHVDYSVDLARRAGQLLEDGSIDLRERNSAIAVQAGQQVARVIHAVAGQDGYDVRGQRLPATQGSEAELTAGDNVSLSASDDGNAVLISDIDGHLSAQADVVHVHAVFTVSRDVDYDVGNIDVPGDVEILGLIGPGFSVQAGGTVTVSGTVEPGATVRAKGDILVGQGILGAKTRVVAGGSVTTKFIQNSLVAAGAHVTVGSYIFSGRVHAGTGCVRVENRGGQRGGSIVGGQVQAGTLVDVHRLGSADTDRTLASIAVEPALAVQVTQLRKAHQQLAGQTQSGLSQLGLSSPNDRQQLARLLARTPAGQLDAVEVQLKALRAQLQQAEQMQGQIDAIESQTRQQLAAGRIRVRQDVFADVQIQFGAAIRQLTEAIPGGCEFFVANGRIRWRTGNEPGNERNATT